MARFARVVAFAALAVQITLAHTLQKRQVMALGPDKESALMNLERTTLSGDNLAFPQIMRLMDLAQSDRDVGMGLRDLEQYAGGSAVRLTQYELDMTEMIWLHAVHKEGIDVEKYPVLASAMKNNKMRQPADAKMKKDNALKSAFVCAKKSYKDGFKAVSGDDGKCVNCLDSNALEAMQGVFKHMPFLEAIGEGVDQFIALQRSVCKEAGEDPFDEFKDGGMDVTNFENAIKQRLGEKTTDDQVKHFISALNYDFKVGDGSGEELKVMSSCMYVRSYLAEHKFYDDVYDDEAASIWAESGEGGDLDMGKAFKLIGDAPEQHVQEVLFKIADISSYFSTKEKGHWRVPTAPEQKSEGKLDKCEFHMLYTMMHNLRDKNDWKTGLFFFDATKDDVTHPRYLSKDDSLMQFKDFKKVVKTVDLGNFVRDLCIDDKTYDLGKLVNRDPDSNGDQDDDQLTYLLFQSMAGEGESIQREELVKFLVSKASCNKAEMKGTEKKRVEKQATNTVLDYGAEEKISYNQFRVALESYPVLVHGLTKDHVQSAAEALGMGNINAMSQANFIKFMVVVQKYGSLLLEVDDGGKSSFKMKGAGLNEAKTLDDYVRVIMGASDPDNNDLKGGESSGGKKPPPQDTPKGKNDAADKSKTPTEETPKGKNGADNSETPTEETQNGADKSETPTEKTQNGENEADNSETSTDKTPRTKVQNVENAGQNQDEEEQPDGSQDMAMEEEGSPLESDAAADEEQADAPAEEEDAPESDEASNDDKDHLEKAGDEVLAEESASTTATAAESSEDGEALEEANPDPSDDVAAADDAGTAEQAAADADADADQAAEANADQAADAETTGSDDAPAVAADDAPAVEEPNTADEQQAAGEPATLQTEEEKSLEDPDAAEPAKDEVVATQKTEPAKDAAATTETATDKVSDTEDAPAATDDAQAATDDAPAATDDTPAATEETPAATEETPAATEEKPAPAPTTDAPVSAKVSEAVDKAITPAEAPATPAKEDTAATSTEATAKEADTASAAPAVEEAESDNADVEGPPLPEKSDADADAPGNMEMEEEGDGAAAETTTTPSQEAQAADTAGAKSGASEALKPALEVQPLTAEETAAKEAPALEEDTTTPQETAAKQEDQGGQSTATKDSSNDEQIQEVSSTSQDDTLQQFAPQLAEDEDPSNPKVENPRKSSTTAAAAEGDKTETNVAQAEEGYFDWMPSGDDMANKLNALVPDISMLTGDTEKVEANIVDSIASKPLVTPAEANKAAEEAELAQLDSNADDQPKKEPAPAANTQVGGGYFDFITDNMPTMPEMAMPDVDVSTITNNLPEMPALGLPAMPSALY